MGYSMKKKLIAGNWKMNGSLAANEALIKALLAGLNNPGCAIAVCVPAIYLIQMYRNTSRALSQAKSRRPC